MRPTGVYEVNSDFDDLQYSIDGFKAVPVSRTRTVQKPVTRTQTRTVKVKNVENKEIHAIEAKNAAFAGEGIPKDILTFTINEDEQPYVGSFTVTMNTGHWYGFAIYKAVYEPDEETGEIDYTNPLWQLVWNGHNPLSATVPGGFATHKPQDPPTAEDGDPSTWPLSMTCPSVTFTPGETYKIQTWECSGGGRDADKFIYSFNLDIDPDTGDETPLDIGIVTWHDVEEEYKQFQLGF
jgi:hypothetical protein